MIVDKTLTKLPVESGVTLFDLRVPKTGTVSGIKGWLSSQFANSFIMSVRLDGTTLDTVEVDVEANTEFEFEIEGEFQASEFDRFFIVTTLGVGGKYLDIFTIKFEVN